MYFALHNRGANGRKIFTSLHCRAMSHLAAADQIRAVGGVLVLAKSVLHSIECVASPAVSYSDVFNV